MAHKKAGGSTKNGRDSNPNYLGVKAFGGEHIYAGAIIVRQRGSKMRAGINVYMSKDHTLHAKIEGLVKFRKSAIGGVNARKVTFVEVEPMSED